MEDEYKSTPKVLFSYNFRKKNLLASINSSYSKFKRDRPNFIKDQFSEIDMESSSSESEDEKEEIPIK